MALELMIQNSIEAQKIFLEGGEPSKFLLKSACTVKLAGPRRSGHTASLAKISFQYFEDPIFVSENHHLALHLKEDFQRYWPNEKFRFVTTHNFETSLRGTEADALLVDCASFISPGKIDRLYYMAESLSSRRLADGQPFCIVLME
jgi:hypothetical protein